MFGTSHVWDHRVVHFGTYPLCYYKDIYVRFGTSTTSRNGPSTVSDWYWTGYVHVLNVTCTESGNTQVTWYYNNDTETYFLVPKWYVPNMTGTKCDLTHEIHHKVFTKTHVSRLFIFSFLPFWRHNDLMTEKLSTANFSVMRSWKISQFSSSTNTNISTTQCFLKIKFTGLHSEHIRLCQKICCHAN